MGPPSGFLGSNTWEKQEEGTANPPRSPVTARTPLPWDVGTSAGSGFLPGEALRHVVFPAGVARQRGSSAGRQDQDTHWLSPLLAEMSLTAGHSAHMASVPVASRGLLVKSPPLLTRDASLSHDFTSLGATDTTRAARQSGRSSSPARVLFLGRRHYARARGSDLF